MSKRDESPLPSQRYGQPGANQKQSAGFGYGWTLVRRRSQVQKLLRTVWIGGILIQGRENFDTTEVDAFEPLLGFVLGLPQPPRSEWSHRRRWIEDVPDRNIHIAPCRMWRGLGLDQKPSRFVV